MLLLGTGRHGKALGAFSHVLFQEKHKNSTCFFLFTTITLPLPPTVTNMLLFCVLYILVQEITYFSCWSGGLQTKLKLHSITRFYKHMTHPLYAMTLLLTYVDGSTTFTVEMRQVVTFNYRKLSKHSSTHIRDQKKPLSKAVCFYARYLM